MNRAADEVNGAAHFLGFNVRRTICLEEHCRPAGQRLCRTGQG